MCMWFCLWSVDVYVVLDFSSHSCVLLSLFGLFFIVWVLQEVFHVYLNKFEIAVTHLFLIIFCNS